MAVNETPRSGDIQSVHRALDLLEAIGEAGELGVTELAHSLGLAVSTVHNILRTMARRSYVISDGGRYRLGPSITVLTSQWDPTQSLSSLVKPELRRISQETGHAATATTLVGREARLIGFEPGSGPVTVSAGQWTWRNPLALATGRVIVAITKYPEWTEFVAIGGEVAQPAWSVDKWQLELEQIARTGLCIKRAQDGKETWNKTTAIAVPVWTRGQSVICSIGCSAPGFLATDHMLQQMLDALWTVAVELSTRLGCNAIPLPKPLIPHD